MNKTRFAAFLPFILVLFLLAPLTAAGPAPTSSTVSVLGSIPQHISILSTPVNVAQTIPIELILTGQNPNGLVVLEHDLYDPASPMYHHWLKPGEFAQRFGASSANIAAVRTFLNANGITTTSLGNSNTVIHARGSISAIQHAFSVQMQNARFKTATFVTNTTNPLIPSTLQRMITGINIQQAPASLYVHTAGLHRILQTHKALTPSGYGPADVRTAFNGQVYTHQGSGQKIGIVGFSTFSSTDLNTYLQQYVCASPCTVSVTTTTTGTTPTGDDGEVTLDLEQVVGLAQSASYYLYRESLSDATSFQDNIAAVATADVVNEASMSYGECEDNGSSAQLSSIHTSLATMSTQGQAFITSSGDTGANDGTGAGCTHQPDADYPASETNAFAVGGVAVSSTSPLSQTSWYDNTYVSGFGYGCAFGNYLCQTGGGVSRKYASGSWQTGTGVVESTYSQTGTYCGQSTGVKCKQVPDVSGISQGMAEYDSVSTPGWTVNVGTSFAAPQWNAFIADLNDAAGSNMGMPMTKLYGYWNNTQNVGYNGFTDVTTAPGTDLYPIGTGYDMDTGMGTPNLAQLTWDVEGFNGWDTFSNRSGVTGGWNGTANATDGQAWGADAASNSAFSVPGGEGDIAGPTSGNQTYNATLGNSTTGTQQALLECNIASWSVNSNIGVVLRWGDANNLYKGYIDGTNAVIQKRISGTSTTLATASFSASVGTWNYWLKFKVSGSNLYLKAWRSDATEPTSWTVTATDSSRTSGKMGVRATIDHSTTGKVFNFYAGNATLSQPT